MICLPVDMNLIGKMILFYPFSHVNGVGGPIGSPEFQRPIRKVGCELRKSFCQYELLLCTADVSNTDKLMVVFFIPGMSRLLCRCYCIANDYDWQMWKILMGQFQAGREESLHNFALLYCPFFCC